MDRQRRILLTEAARRLGISTTTMRRLVTEGRVKTYENPLDKRQKLVDEAAIEELRRQAPATDDPGKMQAAA